MIRLTEVKDRIEAIELACNILNVPTFCYLMELRGVLHGGKREIQTFVTRENFENARTQTTPISQHILAVEFIWVGSRYFQITWQ